MRPPAEPHRAAGIDRHIEPRTVADLAALADGVALRQRT
jgi:hypothetical protein